jgi:molybdopterin molybdotransferase
VLDTISPVLVALLPFARTRVVGGIPDGRNSLIRALRAASRSSDLIITIGGSSVGPHDLTKDAVRHAGTLLFGGVRVNVLKRGGVGEVAGVPVVILPGQIGSAIAVWHEHGLHVVSRVVGREQRRWQAARLGRRVVNTHRMDSIYLFRVRDGFAIAGGWGVHNSLEFLRADGFAVLPRGQVALRGDRLLLQRLDGAPLEGEPRE